MKKRTSTTRKIDEIVKSPVALFRSWFYILRYLRTGVTMNGKSDTYTCDEPFALMYRRVNGTFYEVVKIGIEQPFRLDQVRLLNSEG